MNDEVDLNEDLEPIAVIAREGSFIALKGNRRLYVFKTLQDLEYLDEGYKVPVKYYSGPYRNITAKSGVPLKVRGDVDVALEIDAALGYDDSQSCCSDEYDNESYHSDESDDDSYSSGEYDCDVDEARQSDEFDISSDECDDAEARNSDEFDMYDDQCDVDELCDSDDMVV